MMRPKRAEAERVAASPDRYGCSARLATPEMTVTNQLDCPAAALCGARALNMRRQQAFFAYDERIERHSRVCFNPHRYQSRDDLCL
jgi:hypothetical protein